MCIVILFVYLLNYILYNNQQGHSFKLTYSQRLFVNANGIAVVFALSAIKLPIPKLHCVLSSHRLNQTRPDQNSSCIVKSTDPAIHFVTKPWTIPEI